jgi:hypothetical protein
VRKTQRNSAGFNMPKPSGLVERPKATTRNRYVITDELVTRVHEKMRSGPVLGGDIADLIWGPNSNRPVNKSAFHQAFSQLSKRYEQKYGVGLMSTAAYRPEHYSGE